MSPFQRPCINTLAASRPLWSRSQPRPRPSTNSGQGTQVVLLQQGRGFLHSVLQHLGVLQLLIALAPTVLPVKGETTHSEHADAQPHEGAIGGPMEIGHPGGPPVEFAT